MNYFVYILKNAAGKLYVGHTNSTGRRLQDHSNSLGAKYVKDVGGEFKLVYTEVFASRAEAMQRERQLKGWTRAKKEALIANDLKKLKAL